MYFDTGDLSTLEYLYDFKWIRASSEMHSATACSTPPIWLAATSTKEKNDSSRPSIVDSAGTAASHQPLSKNKLFLSNVR